jgi:predicted AAA+ superfamily ATPase
LAAGIAKENILYLNFFDHRLGLLLNGNLGSIAEAYYSLFTEKKNAETVYCFFDEIQVAKGWEPFVERLMRTEKCEVFLTGSSSKLLSKELASQMRERSILGNISVFF